MSDITSIVNVKLDELTSEQRAAIGTEFLFLGPTIPAPLMNFLAKHADGASISLERVLSALYGVAPTPEGMTVQQYNHHMLGYSTIYSRVDFIGIEVTASGGRTPSKSHAYCGLRRRCWYISNVTLFLQWLATHDSYRYLPCPPCGGMTPSEFRATLRTFWDVVGARQVLERLDDTED